LTGNFKEAEYITSGENEKILFLTCGNSSMLELRVCICPRHLGIGLALENLAIELFVDATPWNTGVFAVLRGVLILLIVRREE
jgi:hypothetical protein